MRIRRRVPHVEKPRQPVEGFRLSTFATGTNETLGEEQMDIREKVARAIRQFADGRRSSEVNGLTACITGGAEVTINDDGTAMIEAARVAEKP
jgi:hypothetical protein